MIIIKEFSNNKIVYDNLINKDSRMSLVIDNYKGTLNFQDIINTQFSGGNLGNEVEKVKSFLNLGIYSKAPCGGFANLYKQKWGEDSIIMFSGVNEVSNSHYIVTVHKILKL
jgi:hypothetical protein